MRELKPEKKRVFFGAEVVAPWPRAFPAGRLLGESSRHMTLAFLGDVPFEPLRDALSRLPLPAFQVGPSGFFDSCLLLPPRRPRVVAWRARWLGQAAGIPDYQRTLAGWLRETGYAIDRRKFLAHVTLARAPVDQRGWRREFKPLPFFVPAIHLYESVGNLVYSPLWSHALTAPMEAIDAPGGGVWRVRGESPAQLQAGALAAAAFRFPERTETLMAGPLPKPGGMEDVEATVRAVLRDAGIDAPRRSEVVRRPNGTLEWEVAPARR